MPVVKKIIRGLQNIRTRSGTPDQVIIPYQVYTRITYLEMEKFRRETERANLVVRLKNVEERLQSIESEKAVLLRRVGKPTPKRPGALAGRIAHPSPPSRAAGFKFRY